QDATLARLDALLDPGLEAANPLDVWGTGQDTRGLFADSLGALAADPGVAVLALGVDMVPEFDGETAYPDALLDTAAGTEKPVVLLSNAHSSLHQPSAELLRAGGVPVLAGTRS